MSKKICWADGYEVGSDPCRFWHETERSGYLDPDPGTVVVAGLVGDGGETIEKPFMRVHAVGGYDGWVGMDGSMITCNTFSHRAGYVVLLPVTRTTWTVIR